MATAWRNRAIELLVWWGVLTSLELLLISAVDRAELLLAVLLGLVGAIVAVAGRLAQPSGWSLPGWSWRALAVLPLSIVRDSVVVFAAAARGASGSWRRFPVAAAAGGDAKASGARAVASLLIAATPSTVAVGVDPDTGQALVHQLAGPAQSRLERALSP
jgi:multisubunit Na+/H+ antiporter MnhE subunit